MITTDQMIEGIHLLDQAGFLQEATIAQIQDHLNHLVTEDIKIGTREVKEAADPKIQYHQQLYLNPQDLRFILQPNVFSHYNNRSPTTRSTARISIAKQTLEI